MLVTVASGLGLAAPVSDKAQATPPSPIVEHYKAYAAALQRNDLPTAETEAVAALAASQEKYGDGGRTAVLAMNLANVRLLQGRYDAAAEPARKALQLAEAGGAAAGVDVDLARLAVARAELRSGGKPAFERLEQAVAATAQVPELASQVYPAAIELASFALETQRYAEAQVAWDTALRLIRTEPDPDALMLARTQLGAAVAGIMMQMRRDDLVARKETRVLGSGRLYADFDEQLVQVIETIALEAGKAGPTDAVTAAQSVYAQAWTWRSVVAAKLDAEGRDLRTRRAPKVEVGEIGASRQPLPACAAHIVAEPAAVFPDSRRVTGGVGSVMLKVRFDETAQVRSQVVAASVGGPAFERSVTDVVPRWHLARDDASQGNCRIEREIFVHVKYRYE